MRRACPACLTRVPAGLEWATDCALAGQLVFWSMAGTLLRLAVQRGFLEEGVTSATGALFPDLPANCLACFLFGLLASGGERRHAARGKALAVLPHGHPLQERRHLHDAARVATAGAFSTYSGFNQSTARLFASGSAWLSALSAIALQLLTALACVSAGMQAAWALSEHHDFLHLLTGESLPTMGLRIMRLPWWGCRSTTTFGSDRSGGTLNADDAAQQSANGVATGSQAVTLGGGAKKLDFFDICFIALSIGAVAGASVGVAVDTAPEHQWRREWWVALLLAPPGVLLRRLLSAQLNRPGLPLGTFCANMLGSLINAIDAALDSRIHSVGSDLAFKGIALGFDGGLSTVSSWAGEMHAMLVPGYGHGPARAYAYAAVTVLCGQVLALAAYGWSVWT